MVALASGPIVPSDQAVLFYCWTPTPGSCMTNWQLPASRGAIEHPFYMPAGEFRTFDPDGYVLLIGQLGTPG